MSESSNVCRAGLLTLIVVLGGYIGAAAPVPRRQNGVDENEPSCKRAKSDGNARCELFLSELQLRFSTSDTDFFPFIELQSRCKKRPGPVPKNMFGRYKLLIVESDPMALVAFIDLEFFPFDDKKPFIVIGSPRVANLDISMSSPHVQSIFSRVEDDFMLPNPNEKSCSIILLRDVTRTEARNLNLYINSEGTFLRRRLTADQMQTIISKSADMVVLGPETEQRRLEFTPYWKTVGLSHGAMFSHHWNSFATSSPDMSWNVCDSSYKGFNAEVFQVALQSPGLPNSCQQSTYLPIFEPTVVSSTTTEASVSQPTKEPKLYHTISVDDYNQMRDHNFKQEMVQQCHEHFAKRENILENDNVQKWLDFITPESCRFTCIACKKYLQLGFRPDFKHKTYMMTKGFLSDNIYKNNDKIKNHEKSEFHQESMSFFQAVRESSTYDELLDVVRLFEDKEKKLFNATGNVLLLTYTEIKSGVSFHTHEAYMKTLRIIGANVGRWHHTEHGAHDIAISFSSSFKRQKLQYMVDMQISFSILADASTTFSQPYLSVYIQTIKDNVPITFFYALIYLDKGEKGKMMADALQKQVERDAEIVSQFLDHFKSFLVSIVSDGAANMVGASNSFRTHLMTFIGRKIPNVECLNHKLDNAFKMGVKPDKEVTDQLDTRTAGGRAKLWQLCYFEGFEKSTNDFYTFYASRGHKRWLHLLDTAKELGLVPKRIKYVYAIRWSDSHYRAIETIHHNYYALVEDLAQIHTETGFDEPSKTKAATLHQRMLDKTYMLVLHEFMDILTVFKIASKQFQEASSVIAGTVTIVSRVLDAMDELKENPGSWLRDFLAGCVCLGKCHEGDCTLQQYDECPEILLNRVRLANHHSIALYYSYVRKNLYENMVSSLKRYFNLELLESFELFNPSNLNLDIESSPLVVMTALEGLYKPEAGGIHTFKTTVRDRVYFICNFYDFSGIHCTQFEEEWRHLLTCIVTSDLKDFESRDAAVFWPYALTKCMDYWTPMTRKMVRFVLVTPFSSSEVERGFSIMNNIKTKARSVMEKETLDGLMRVKINGPDVENLDAYKYTIEYLRQFARVDDMEVNGGRKSSDDQGEEDEPESIL